MKSKKMKLLYNVFVVILLAGCIIWVFSRYVHRGNVEFTNNAQVKQQIVPIQTRVQGYVGKVNFSDYQKVKKGDTLLVIDDAEYRLKLAQAEADYQNAITGKKAMGTTILASQSNICSRDAEIEACRIQMENARKEFERYNSLLSGQSVTKQQYDNVKTAFNTASARYEQMLSQKKSASLVKDEQTIRLNQNDAQIKLAEAALALAKLNLSYTVITAPCNGVTGRKNVETGQLLLPGQGVVDLVNESELWIIANYKETQTARMKEGLPVKISADGVPKIKFSGKIQAISGATCASFSIFPQDNSSGNFIKVTQRIPVRIIFTENNKAADLLRLRSGMNVECEVLY